MRNQGSNNGPHHKNSFNPGTRGEGRGPNTHGINQGSNINPLNNNFIKPGIRGYGLGPNAHGINKGQGSNIDPKTSKPYEIGDQVPRGNKNPSN